MKRFSKILAIVLCLATVLSLVPMFASAASGSVEFTGSALGLSGTYVAGTKTVNGVAVEWIQLSDYGDGIQMRDSEKNGEMRTSQFWNTSAFGSGITKIELTYSDTRDVAYSNDDAVIFKFGNTVKGASYTTKLSTTAGDKTYTITPDKNTYTYFYMEHDLGYTFYWKSIKVYYGGSITPADPEPTPQPLTVVPVSTALAGSAGTSFKVKGVATLIDGKNVYVQDSTGAICVRMNANVEDVNVGDTIVASGSRADYNGLPQLGNGTYEKSSGSTLSTKATTISALTTKDLCKYIKLSNLTVTEIDDGDGTYSYPNVTFSDGKNEILLYKGVVPANLKVGDKVNISCALSCYNDTLQLRNTKASEITSAVHVCSEFTYTVTYPTATTAGSHVKTCKECGKSTKVNYTFPDVPTSLWSHDAIDFAVIKGFFTGYKSGKFGPTDSITRQDFVVVLARIAKVDLSKYAGRTKFSDVKAGDYYEAAVKWASSNGIVNGYNNGKFGVGDKITREQLVTILYNYAKKMGYSTSVPSNAAAKLNTFKDAGKVSSYAKPAVIWALNKGIISGMSETTVGPQESASRGQVATILMNISKKGIMPI